MMPPVYKVDKVLLSRTLKKVPLVTESKRSCIMIIGTESRFDYRARSCREAIVSRLLMATTVLMTNDRPISRRKKATNILISRYDDLALFSFPPFSRRRPPLLRLPFILRRVSRSPHLLVLHINICSFEISKIVRLYINGRSH